MLLVAGLLALIASAVATEECGRYSRSFFEGETYMVGGKKVQHADSVVSVQVFKSDELWNDHEWKHVCGGVLLNKRWVLTAAHCIKEAREWGAARVVLGTTKLNGTIRQEIPIRRMFEHPEWTPITRTNDLALIELKGEASPDRTVSPACVNSNLTEVIKYESCAALGWGKANESSDFSQDLTTIPLNMLTYPQCMRAYRNMNGVRISEKFHICAGRMGEPGKGICQGDLGGPLFCRTSAQKNVQLVGIATNGAACGSPQHPGVFVRVDSFLSWIRDTTDDSTIGDFETNIGTTDRDNTEMSTDDGNRWDRRTGDDRHTWYETTTEGRHRWDEPSTENTNRWDDMSTEGRNRWDEATTENRNRWDEWITKGYPWHETTTDGRNRWDEWTTEGRNRWHEATTNDRNRWDEWTTEGRNRWDEGTRTERAHWDEWTTERGNRWDERTTTDRKRWDERDHTEDRRYETTTDHYGRRG